MKMLSLCAALFVTLLLPAAAHAQGGPGIFPRIAGEEVIVTQSTSGGELRGRIVELSKTTLGLLVDGQRLDVPIDNVLRIDTRTDSLKNGAFIGGGIMFGMAAFACAAGFSKNAAQCATGVVFNTLFGTLAGIGIDALHKGRTTIYSKPAAVAIAVAPAGKGGVARLTVRW
jgi:hypothetical protein